MNGPDAGKDRRRRFDTAIAVLRPEMVRLAFWLARDRQLAEDVVQEAMLRAWKSMDSLDDPAHARRRLARAMGLPGPEEGE